MELDYQFVADILEKHYKHLSRTEFYIEGLKRGYARQVEEYSRLVGFKPEIYQGKLERVEQKIVEADIKLSYIVPAMKKINEQVEIIKKLTAK